MEFLRYPQVITDYFNRRVFGPPQRFTAASTCSWIGHPVSCLRHDTYRSFQTRFRFGSETVSLNLASYRNSPARSTKSTTSLSLCLLVSIRFQVLFHSPPGVLFTFPSRYYTLSVTWSYLAFGDGPPFFRQDSSCPDVLWIPLAFVRILNTGLLPSSAYLSRYVLLYSLLACCGPYLIHISIYDLGWSDFARHYFRNRYLLSFPPGN